jgi:hypothetical protein
MCSRGVLVHCPSRLGAAVAVLAAKLLCSDGVFTKWTLEHAKSVHHFDGVMSHSFKCSRLSWYDSELKLPCRTFPYIEFLVRIHVFTVEYQCCIGRLRCDTVISPFPCTSGV